MKVLHVGPIGFRPGAGSLPKKGSAHSATGLPPSIRGFASAQAAIGLDVGLMSSTALPEGKSVEDLSGVYLLKGPNKRHYNPWSISEEWLVRIREEFGVPDLVHFHSTYIPFNIALAKRCRQLGWPYIVTAHGGMTYLAQNVKGLKRLIANFLFFRSYVKNAAAIHALSPKEAEEIQALFKVEKIITVSNGVEDYLLGISNQFAPVDLGYFRSEGDLVLGFIGRIDVYHKGLDLLLEAMAILKSQLGGFRCKLFVIGPFYTKKNERILCSAMESLNLKDEVRLLGPKYGGEKWRHFLACDIFVHTSRFEGMPMAVLEAMALGRPCLVTPGTNVADIVREGGGWVCEPEPRSIAEAVKSIYKKRDSLIMLGQRSRELMRNRFTWCKVAKRLTEGYMEIVKQSKIRV